MENVGSVRKNWNRDLEEWAGACRGLGVYPLGNGSYKRCKEGG